MSLQVGKILNNCWKVSKECGIGLSVYKYRVIQKMSVSNKGAYLTNEIFLTPPLCIQIAKVYIIPGYQFMFT